MSWYVPPAIKPEDIQVPWYKAILSFVLSFAILWVIVNFALALIFLGQQAWKMSLGVTIFVWLLSPHLPRVVFR